MAQATTSEAWKKTLEQMEAWRQALERMEATGWHYEFLMYEDVPAYRYVTEDKHLYAVVTDKTVVIGIMFGAELFRRKRTIKDPYFALARGARCVDELAGTFKNINSMLDISL